MKKKLPLFVPAIALLALPAPAQYTQYDDSNASLANQTVRILQQPGARGTGVGAWLSPTNLELGSAQGTLVGADGHVSYELDAALTRYVFLGLGIEYGGLSGALTPAHGSGGVPILVEGEWLRIDGRTGEFNAMIFEPTGGMPAVKLIGALHGRIAFDSWIEPDPADGAGGTGDAGSGLVQSLQIMQGGATDLRDRETFATRHGPFQAPSSAGRSSGAQMQSTVTRMRVPSKNARGQEILAAGQESATLIEGRGGRVASGPRIAGAVVESASTHVDLGGEGLFLGGTDIVFDPTRTGTFLLTYRMLD